ncbi:MAG TPA: hypothetical protein ENF45_04330 [Bacteroidetes bacterium]|nr:hypothetical protein [Bacteroidota bacterium]
MLVQLKFFRGKRGDVISRLPSGKVALVNRKAKKPKIGEKWICKIDFEKENFAVITPIARIVRKQRPIYKVYKCGHRVLWKTEEVEVPENSEPEPKTMNWDFEICDDCKKNCKHSKLKISRSSFELWIKCAACDKTMATYELEMDKINEIIKDISERFPQVAEEVAANLGSWITWTKEYREHLKQKDNLEGKISKILSEIKEWVRENFDNYKEDEFYSIRVDEEKEELEYFVGYTEVPRCLGFGPGGKELYEYESWPAFRKVKNIPENIKEKIRKIKDLREELNSVLWWLTENRPVE